MAAWVLTGRALSRFRVPGVRGWSRRGSAGVGASTDTPNGGRGISELRIVYAWATTSPGDRRLAGTTLRRGSFPAGVVSLDTRIAGAAEMRVRGKGTQRTALAGRRSDAGDHAVGRAAGLHPVDERSQHVEPVESPRAAAAVAHAGHAGQPAPVAQRHFGVVAAELVA